MTTIHFKDTLPKPPEAEAPPVVHPTLRYATLEDIPYLVELGRDLYKGSSFEAVSLDEAKAIQKLEAFITGDKKDFLALVSHDEGKTVGVLAAYAFEPLFSSERISCEVLWYLEPEYRKGRRGIEMMQAYEYWSKLVGCKVAQYGLLDSSPPRMKALYERTGARLAEQTYFKIL